LRTARHAPDIRQYGLLICRGELDPIPSGLRAFVEAGGHLYLHRPGQRSLRDISRVFGLDLETQASAGPISRSETSAGAADGIAREDLYWFGKNDFNANGEDRNLRLDRVAFYHE